MKKVLKQLSFKVFELAARAGLFILPAHYYIPIASIGELRKTKDSWAQKSSLPGITVDLDAQVELMRTICSPFENEYAGNEVFRSAVEQQFGPGYGYIEAQALHGVVRHFKPRTIIEVGSGVSTVCMLAAKDLNEKEGGPSCHMISIEPYPSDALQGMAEIELISSPVQQVPIGRFEALKDGDFLFIDSSHTIKPGGDVNWLFLEVLPRLAKGVIVHIHDIYLPYDYPRDVMRTYFQWMETSLLRAFLINNDHARIVFCMSHLHYDRPEAMREIFPEYVPAPDKDGLELSAPGKLEASHFPASIYIEIV